MFTVLLAGELQAQPLTYLVGGDNCDFTSIQSAINAAGNNPGPDTIRVAMNLTYTAQALRVAAQDLTIEGGFATCASAAPSPGAMTTISGASGATDSTLVITGSGTLALRGLTITGGDETDDGKGGGIDFEGAGQLTIQDAAIRGNQAGHGGGINFNGATSAGATLALGANVVVENNVALNSGGGVRIQGRARLFMIEANSAIVANRALGDASDSGYGGGLHILSPAQAEIGSPARGTLGATSTNEAKYGGGIAITDSSAAGHVLLCTTDAQRPVRIDHNIASISGGGVYLEASIFSSQVVDAELCAYEFRIDHNRAGGERGDSVQSRGQSA